MTRLRATPLAPFERDGLKSALSKAGLPSGDLGKSSALFWRFETPQDVPVGFGGLEIFGTDALLRSIVILPVLRRSGFGRAIVTAIEQEAQAHNCRALYLVTSDADFFTRQGYDPCGCDAVPAAVRESGEFSAQAEPVRKAMVKHLVA